jgi:chitin disaccharide deacetylase
MDRRIIVNADDLGLSPSVNTAIFEVFRAGNLSSATMMASMPGTLDAAERVKDHPALAVGLHFALTEAQALGGRSTLTDGEGRLQDRSTLMKAVYRGRVDPADIARELTAQLDRLRELGIDPVHVDSHQHVHMAPKVFRAMQPILEAQGLPLRLVDPPWPVVAAAWRRPPKAAKQWLNRIFARRLRARYRGPTNDALVSVHDLSGPGPYNAGTYRRLLAYTPPDAVVEVMVHPYILGNDVLAVYSAMPGDRRPFLRRCAAEYEALTGERVFGDATLIRFGDP